MCMYLCVNMCRFNNDKDFTGVTHNLKLIVGTRKVKLIDVSSSKRIKNKLLLPPIWSDLNTKQNILPFTVTKIRVHMFNIQIFVNPLVPP